MPRRLAFQTRKVRTPIIGTTLVLLGGIVTCLLIAVPFSDDLTVPLLVIAGLFCGLAIMLGALRVSGEELLAAWWESLFTKPPKTVRYHVRRVDPLTQTGPCQPPTVESIREIRGK